MVCDSIVTQRSAALYKIHCAFNTCSEATLRAAGLILRRQAGREFFSYIPLPEYSAEHYEVLLRRWPVEPFLQHLGAFSGPVIEGQVCVCVCVCVSVCVCVCAF